VICYLAGVAGFAPPAPSSRDSNTAICLSFCFSQVPQRSSESHQVVRVDRCLRANLSNSVMVEGRKERLRHRRRNFLVSWPCKSRYLMRQTCQKRLKGRLLCSQSRGHARKTVLSSFGACCRFEPGHDAGLKENKAVCGCY